MALDKLVDSTQLDSDLTSVANAIRAKSGGSSQLAFPGGFVNEIGNIPSGGGARTESGSFTVASGYIQSKGIEHNLNSTRLFGMIWLKPDANNQVVAPGGYNIVFSHFITFNFATALYDGTEIVENYTSSATKTAAYPKDSVPILRAYKSTWTNAAAGWSEGEASLKITGTWAVANDSSKFTFYLVQTSIYMRPATYYWQVWALDDWAGDS